MEGAHSPFIDERDSFTGERERVQMFLSLVAHADEDWIMVGAPNTIDVAEVVLSSSGRMDASTCKYYLMPSGM